MTPVQAGGNAVFAAADWGTSSFRLWLVDGDGAVLGEKRSGEGMATAVASGGFAAVLERHLSALGAPADLPVIACGMVGARQGWVEVPYVEAPAAFDAIAANAVRVAGAPRDVAILPGVCRRDAGSPDVMRGEETQVMGLGAEGLVCLPGTHSKWVAVDNGRISDFSTFMTGELFALLSQQSILRHTVSERSDADTRPEAFAAGVRDALDAPESILNRMFGLRAGALLGLDPAEDVGARLSGLLIGLEIAGAKRRLPDARSVTLAVSGPLSDLYARALGVAGFAVETADAEAAVRRGLSDAARRCFALPEFRAA